MVATGETVGLAEWIIDDTCLVQMLIWNGKKIKKILHDMTYQTNAIFLMIYFLS